MEGNLTTVLQVLGLVIQFLIFVALILAAAAALYYAVQAKRQADKTHELVILGEKEYEPNAVVRITETEGVSINEEKGAGLLISNECLTCISAEFTNLSKGVSKFLVTVTAWFEITEEKRNQFYTRKVDLNDKITNGYYRGKNPHLLVRNEVITGHLFISLKELFCLEEIRTESEQFVMFDTLSKGSLHLEISVDYLDKIVDKSYRFYDHYYTRLTRRKLDLPDVYYLIVGRWVFGGRKEKRFPRNIA